MVFLNSSWLQDAWPIIHTHHPDLRRPTLRTFPADLTRATCRHETVLDTSTLGHLQVPHIQGGIKTPLLGSYHSPILQNTLDSTGFEEKCECGTSVRCSQVSHNLPCCVASQFLNFQSSSPLMCLRKQQQMAEVLELLHPPGDLVVWASAWAWLIWGMN